MLDDGDPRRDARDAFAGISPAKGASVPGGTVTVCRRSESLRTRSCLCDPHEKAGSVGAGVVDE